MTRLLSVIALATLGATSASAQTWPDDPPPLGSDNVYATYLRVGEPAPPFSLQGSDGKTHTLADYKGRTVVLAWFPKAFTGGCTAECKSLAANDAVLKQYEIALFMASVDALDTNTRFAREQLVGFPILADPDKKVARAYGVIRLDRPQLQQLAARWTFYIGPDGRISAIDKAPTTETAGEVMVKKLEELGVKKR